MSHEPKGMQNIHNLYPVFMSFSGHNQEDSFIFNSSSISEGLFRKQFMKQTPISQEVNVTVKPEKRVCEIAERETDNKRRKIDMS